MPLHFKFDYNKTIVYIRFGVNSIEVEKEIESYSFGSLVAECGGVLGLFIGFNFLMIWDWIHDSIRKIKHYFTTLK